MTVLDSSAAIDYLLADGTAAQVQALLAQAAPAAAPDLLVFEVLAVLRRDAARGELTEARALGAIEDLGDLASSCSQPSRCAAVPSSCATT